MKRKVIDMQCRVKEVNTQVIGVVSNNHMLAFLCINCKELEREARWHKDNMCSNLLRTWEERIWWKEEYCWHIRRILLVLLKLDEKESLGRSLTYKISSKRPRMEPSGTPTEINNSFGGKARAYWNLLKTIRYVHNYETNTVGGQGGQGCTVFKQELINAIVIDIF